MANEIEIYRGDNETIIVNIVDYVGAAFDLTSYIPKLTVKKDTRDANANAIIGPITGTVTDAAGGVCSFTLTIAHTDVEAGEYFYDIEISSGVNVKTVIKSTFTVIDDVTK